MKIPISENPGRNPVLENISAFSAGPDTIYSCGGVVMNARQYAEFDRAAGSMNRG